MSDPSGVRQAAKVKLCGLMSIADIAAAQSAGADYIGFVMAASKRKVDPANVRQWLDEVACASEATERVAPTPVLVVVDEPVHQIVSYTEQTGVRHVQLCGDEPPEECERLRAAHGLTVWKAWGVRGNAQDRALRQYADAVDAVLLDRHKTTSHGGTGGTGLAFPWEQIAEIGSYVPGVPMVIAGGLTVDSVGLLLTEHQPFAVDVSSGIETGGRKDPDKMRAFVQRVRSVPYVPR